MVIDGPISAAVVLNRPITNINDSNNQAAFASRGSQCYTITYSAQYRRTQAASEAGLAVLTKDDCMHWY